MGPLVMTLGTGLMTQGIIIVYSQKILASRSIVPDFIHAIGSDRLGGLIPLDLFLWLPIAALVLITLQRTGSAVCSMLSETIARAVG
jgi:ribose/xylose/arabinose/galactoside ABC-type transport system permease subunit